MTVIFPLITSTVNIPSKEVKMCDYSLNLVKNRRANIGDIIVTQPFWGGTQGFADTKDKEVAICLRPGDKIIFDEPVGIMSIFKRFNKHIATEAEYVYVTSKRKDRQYGRKQYHHDSLKIGWFTYEINSLKPGLIATVISMESVDRSKKAVEELISTALEIPIESSKAKISAEKV